MATGDRLKARLPRGFADRAAEDIRAVTWMVEEIRRTYDNYGFEPVETPLVEYTDALGKFLPDQDRPNEGVFSFQDDDEQWLSLRYDLTAPLARYVAENFERLPKPYRSYRAGWVFRNEKPGPGRFRQFMQFDADTVGTPSIAADAEICMMAADTMEKLGIARGEYVVKVNNRKVLDGLLEAINLGGPENAARRLTVLRAIDKFDRLGARGVEALLGEYRIDESGDRTEGAKLSSWQIQTVLGLLNVEPSSGIRADSRRMPKAAFEQKWGDSPYLWFSKLDLNSANNDIAEFLNDWLGIINFVPDTLIQGLRELKEIGYLATACDYDGTRIRIDPSVVRGLEYYTGPVYEVELLFDVVNEDGETVRFGSVAGGGRYDGLVSRFLGEPVPATGFSIGVSRLLAALKSRGLIGGAAAAGPVVVLVMDRDTAALAGYQRMVAALRAAGIRSELYLGGAGMKAQMKYADRRGAPCVIIQGSNERARGVVQIKDLVEGKRLAEGIADNKEWRESRPAQVEVAETDLVGAVRDILARHQP